MRKENISINKDFETTLNKQGFGFQYAVIREIQRLIAENFSEHENRGFPNWSIDCAEVPVEVQGYNTHIDFVLTRQKNSDFKVNGVLKIIAECKRVDPALSNWCFLRAPFTKKYGIANSIRIEKISVEGDELKTSLHVIPTSEENFFEIPLIVKSNQIGDGNSAGDGRKAIDETITQVLRGHNGFINLLVNNRKFLKNGEELFILPVIFTTAPLWISNAKLDSADLQTGKILLTEELISKDWIFYEYNQSPTLKHSISLDSNESYFVNEGSLSRIVEKEYSRTIAIVSSTGIENFFQSITYRHFG
jgi:hypothetical protein